MKKSLKVLFGLCVPMLVGVLFASAYASACTDAKVAYAEEEEVAEVVEDETTPQEEIKTWAEQSYNTFIVPLFAGVSLTSIFSLLVCIAISVFKDKKLDKKLVEIAEREERCTQVLDKATAIVQNVEKIYEMVEHTGEISEETKQYINEGIDVLEKQIAENTGKVAEIEPMKKILCVLVQLNTKVAKQSSELVKSGIIDDISELYLLVKKL